MAWDAELVYNEAYARWPRDFIGSSAWRSGAVTTAELGWTLSGYERALLDVATRRARLWSLPAVTCMGMC